MESASGELIVLTTLSDRAQVESFARGLVEKRIAACVNVLPGALSFFRWESEEVKAESEQVLLIKTHQEKLPELERYFEHQHPYEVPELIVMEAAGLLCDYKAWLTGELRAGA